METIRKRTTNEQLEIVLSFMSQNPEFKDGKNSPKQPAHLKEKWDELASLLNSLSGPTRTSEQWKTSLMHWKNQVRSKARKIKVDMLLLVEGHHYVVDSTAWKNVLFIKATETRF